MSRQPPLTDDARARAALEAARLVRATLDRHHEESEKRSDPDDQGTQ